MEEHVVRLEADVAHIKTDVADMKTDTREMRKDITAIRDSVVSLELRTRDLITALEQRMVASFTELKVGRVLDKVWSLTIAAALLGVMARGFKWI